MEPSMDKALRIDLGTCQGSYVHFFDKSRFIETQLVWTIEVVKVTIFVLGSSYKFLFLISLAILPFLGCLCFSLYRTLSIFDLWTR